MKLIILILYISLFAGYVNAKDSTKVYPFPVELLVGQKGTVYKTTYYKQILNSSFKLFNLTTYQTNYGTVTDSYFIKAVVYYDLPKGFSIGSGVNLISGTSAKPLLSGMYSLFTKNVGFVIQPGYEIHKDGVFEVFSFYKYTASKFKKLNPYFKMSAFTSFKSGHSYSFLNLRVGLKYKSFIVGPAINTDFFGQEFSASSNYGGFLSFLIH